MNNDLPTDLRKVVSDLDRDLEAYGREYPAGLETAKPARIIYHYTDYNGLRGIIENGTLWFTDIFYLNDPSELHYAVSTAMDILSATTMGASERSQLFARDFRQNYTNSVEEIAHYFVCSFSAKGNDLGQWRAYGDNGRGYAIGFDGDALDDVFTKLNGAPIREHMTFPVSYNTEELKRIYRRFIDQTLARIADVGGRGFSRGVIDRYLQELRFTLGLQVFRTAMFFKHPAYVDEEEYRFMQVHPSNRPPTNVRFRSRPHTLLRYLEFDWKRTAPNAFREIVIGPAAEPRAAGRFINDCLKAYFPTATPSVRLSGIPYRAS